MTEQSYQLEKQASILLGYEKTELTFNPNKKIIRKRTSKGTSSPRMQSSSA